MKLANQYTRRRDLRPVLGIVLGVAMLIGLVFLIGFVSPNNWFIEAVGIMLLSLGVMLTVSWVRKSRKDGLIVTAAVVLMLILRRFGGSELFILGAVVLLIGLISFFN